MSGSSLSSPLTMQMLLASGGASQDPALTAALPRLQFAQALMQQGSSDAPTSKWGALSRLGQALVGNIAFDKSQEGIQDILKQRQADTVNAMQYMRGGTSPATAAPAATPGGPAPVATYATQLASSEAPNAGTVNPGGYSGQFQYGASRLADPGVGVYAPAPGEDLNANQWRGTFNIPNFPNVKTHADFLASPDAQKAVLGIDTANTDKTIAALPGAAAFDPNGLRAVAHLGGLNGMSQFVSTGGQYNPADANGTKLSDYYQKFSGQPVPQPGASAPAQAQPSVDQSLEMMRRAQDMMAAQPYNPAIQHAAQAQMQYAQTLMGLAEKRFTVGPNGVQTSGMGEQKSAATPTMNYQADPNTPGVMTSPGAKPVVMPSPRPVTLPSGAVAAVGPGGGVTEIAAADNPGVAARAAAGSQGKETGTIAAHTPDKMFDLGRESDQAINNIDYGLNQLSQAKQGGITTGYFAPWLATAAAAGKSLGIDTKALGVDPSAVGNIQSAQKTLGVVAGAILQNAIGKDSQITDAKINHFIHTQPGIETDPQAIDRVLGWVRSQFSYSRDMAMDAMRNVDPNTGMLPPGWRSSYVARKGAFAPIYDPLSGESTQPQGQGPSPAPPGPAPASQPAPAAAAPTRADLEAEMRRRGLIH